MGKKNSRWIFEGWVERSEAKTFPNIDSCNKALNNMLDDVEIERI